MMPFTHVTPTDLWSATGAVAEAAAGLATSYSPRAEQQHYAALVTEALARDRTAIVPGIQLLEGGTGIGKTLGYLVPGGLEIARHGGRMLVSTFTLALMRQIAHHDGPVAVAAVARLTGRRLQVAQLRGRRSFASPSRCRAAAAQLKADAHPPAAFEPYLALAAQAEAAAHRAGSLLATQDPDVLPSSSAPEAVLAALIDVFASDTGADLAHDDICLLPSCPDIEQAPYHLNRRLADAADILITTHATTAIHLARRTLPGRLAANATLAPGTRADATSGSEAYRYLVVDEADQWATAAASVTAASVSLDALERSVADLMAATRDGPAAQAVNPKGADAIALVDVIRSQAPTAAGTTAGLNTASGTVATLSALADSLRTMLDAAILDTGRTASASGHLASQADELDRALRALRSNTDLWTARWQTSRVHAKPSITVTTKAPGRLMRRLWHPSPGGTPHLATSTLLTSATLSTPGFGETARWKGIEIATGVSAVDHGAVHTDLCAVIHPADFGRLAVRFADPRAPVPSPGADGNLDAAAIGYITAVIAAARACGGRVLVLVPSYQDVAQLAPCLDPATLLHRSGTALHDHLTAYSRDPTACLITPAAWLGTDLPGLIDHLVIPRLPFPPPDSATKGTPPPSAAADPAAPGILASMLGRLTQGIGRAIRRPEDAATLWFADPRMPIPPILAGSTFLLPHPASRPFYLAAIPARFRARFTTDPTAAALALNLDDITAPAVGPATKRPAPSHRRAKRTQR